VTSRALEQEIDYLVPSPGLILSIVALGRGPYIFGPLPRKLNIISFETEHPINTMRRTQQDVISYHKLLMNYEDVTEYALARFHGTLSSINLVYGLALLHNHVSFFGRIYKDPPLKELTSLITTTLKELEGVFNHVENQYLCPHV
jgi:hypothetical protein